MKDKTSRLEVIKMIVSHQAIGSQEELLREVDKAGFPVTQATLSRDLRQLKVSKTSTPSGKYVYALPNSPHYKSIKGYRSRCCKGWFVPGAYGRLNFPVNWQSYIRCPVMPALLPMK